MSEEYIKACRQRVEAENERDAAQATITATEASRALSAEEATIAKRHAAELRIECDALRDALERLYDASGPHSTMDLFGARRKAAEVLAA